MAKKGSEKLKCNDLFFFYSILPPKKWGKTIESLLTFPKVEISGLLTILRILRFTYGGLIGLNFENFKTVSKCKTDSFK